MTFEQEKDKPIGRVLIVEDTPIAAKIADMILTEHRCLTTLVVTGEEALLKINASFDFVLMDLGLPGIDGFETTQQIRLGHPDISQIPIIALTAHEDSHDRISFAKDIGMNGFLSKPFNREKSILLIDAFIHQKQRTEFLTLCAA